MTDIAREVDLFLADRSKRVAEARQRAALLLICGIDLDCVLGASAPEITRALTRIGRIIERERLKGARRHWSYDLNRHIALKQVEDRLRDALGRPLARKRHDASGNSAAERLRRRRARLIAARDHRASEQCG